MRQCSSPQKRSAHFARLAFLSLGTASVSSVDRRFRPVNYPGFNVAMHIYCQRFANPRTLNVSEALLWDLSHYCRSVLSKVRRAGNCCWCLFVDGGYWRVFDLASQTVEVEDLSPSGLLLMRVFFHEIIAAGDDASFMEVYAFFCVCVLLQRCVVVVVL